MVFFCRGVLRDFVLAAALRNGDYLSCLLKCIKASGWNIFCLSTHIFGPIDGPRTLPDRHTEHILDAWTRENTPDDRCVSRSIYAMMFDTLGRELVDGSGGVEEAMSYLGIDDGLAAYDVTKRINIDENKRKFRYFMNIVEQMKGVSCNIKVDDEKFWLEEAPKLIQKYGSFWGI